ncbi:hypothetical protein L6R53_00745 [Myxococcota bacterium]|nr:hypothetical protein [Myxococcota bacterium]
MPLTLLYAPDGRILGTVPLLQAQALAAASSRALEVQGEVAHLGAPIETPGLPHEVVGSFPAPIALCYRQLLEEVHPFTRLHRLIDCFEATIELLCVVALQAVLAKGTPPSRLQARLRERLPRPLTSAWVDLFEAARKARRQGGGPWLLGDLDGTPLQALCEPLLALRNRTAHGAVPPAEACTDLFEEALPQLHGLLDALSPLAGLELVEVGEGVARRLRGAEPGPWGEVARPVGVPAGHVAVRHGEGDWLDLFPLVLVEGQAVTTLLPVFQYAGVRRRTVEFLAHHAGRRVARPDVLPLVVGRYFPEVEAAEEADPGGLEGLFVRHSKYDLLDLAARGVVRLEALAGALAEQPEASAALVGQLLAASGLLRAELEQTRRVLAAAWVDPEAGALARTPRLRVEAARAPALPDLAAAPRPLAPARLFGRDGLVAEVLALLTVHPLVTLWGMGGVGKTTASRAVQVAAGARFPAGVYEVDLRGATTCAAVGERVAEALGLPVPTGRPADCARSLAQGVGGRPVLVVLDNAEPVVDADGAALRALVEGLAGHGGGPHLLVTSRQPVGGALERVVAVGPLDDGAAAALVQAVAAAGGLVASDQWVADAVAAGGGLPLALELAARSTAARPQVDLGEALARSLQALSEQDRRLLLAAAACPAGVAPWLADGLGLLDADRAVARSHGLLGREAGRWRVHELVRAAVATDVGTLVPTLVAAFGGALSTWRARYDTGQSTAARDWFQSERGNLEAVLLRCAPDRAVSLFDDAWRMFLWTGASAAGLRVGQTLLARLHGAAAGQVACQAATMAYFMGRAADGLALADQALVGIDPSLAHRASYIRSTCLRSLGRLDEAEAEMRRAEAGARAVGDMRQLGNCLKELGVIADTRGEPGVAVAHLQAAVGRYQAEGMDIERGFVVQCQGAAERHRGRPQAARELAQEALALGRRLGEPRVQGYAQVDLALLDLDGGRWAAAAGHLDHADAAWRAADHVSGLQRVALLRARVEAALGRFDRAWALLERIEAPLGSGLDTDTLLARAGLAAALGRPWLARELAVTARAQAATSGDARAVLTAGELLDGPASVAASWARLGDARSAALAGLPAATPERASEIFAQALADGDARLEALAALRLAATTGEAGWASHAQARLGEVGTALEQWEAAGLAAAGGDAAAFPQRAAIHRLLGAGALDPLRAALGRLPAPRVDEAELLTWLSVDDVAALRRTWTEPALAAVASRWALLLTHPLPGLVAQLRASLGPPRGEEDLAAVAALHLADLVAR